MGLLIIKMMVHVPDEQIIRERDEGIALAKEFFAKNPHKKTCTAGGWYDTIIEIRRGHEQEDMTRAADEAIKRFKK